MEDVTQILHPELARIALLASKVLQIPVVGIDLLVSSVDRADYVLVEANERPGLAMHEPQPIYERFLDLLCPQDATAADESLTMHTDPPTGLAE